MHSNLRLKDKTASITYHQIPSTLEPLSQSRLPRNEYVIPVCVIEFYACHYPSYRCSCRCVQRDSACPCHFNNPDKATGSLNECIRKVYVNPTKKSDMSW